MESFTSGYALNVLQLFQCAQLWSLPEWHGLNAGDGPGVITVENTTKGGKHADEDGRPC